MNKIFLALLSLFITPLFTSAAPHPGAASSALSDPLHSSWMDSQDFKLSIPRSEEWQWSFLERAELVRLEAHSSKSNQSIVLSIHLDTATKTLPKSQEYTNLGFQVINTGNLQNNNQAAHFWDLFHPEKKKQVRQYLLKTEKGLLSYSCSGDPQSLQKFSKSCTEIFQSLKVK